MAARGKGKAKAALIAAHSYDKASVRNRLKQLVQSHHDFSRYYNITDYIGRGEHSIVFKADGLGKKRGVAACVKIELQKGPGQLAILNMEKNIIVRLAKDKKATNLIRFEDCFLNIDYPDEPTFVINVIVSQLCGQRVDEWLAAHPSGMSHVAQEVVTCMEQAHKQGYIHRDVQPGNFCMELKPSKPTRPHVVMIDFGISKEHDQQEREYRTNQREPLVVGSEPYQSLAAQTMDVQSYKDDIESAGFMLWQLCAGPLPWEEVRASAEITRLKREAPLKQAPKPLRVLFEHVRSLEFGQMPNYSMLRSELGALGTAHQDEETAAESSPPAKKSKSTRKRREKQDDENDETTVRHVKGVRAKAKLTADASFTPKRAASPGGRLRSRFRSSFDSANRPSPALLEPADPLDMLAVSPVRMAPAMASVLKRSQTKARETPETEEEPKRKMAGTRSRSKRRTKAERITEDELEDMSNASPPVPADDLVTVDLISEEDSHPMEQEPEPEPENESEPELEPEPESASQEMKRSPQQKLDSRQENKKTLFVQEQEDVATSKIRQRRNEPMPSQASQQAQEQQVSHWGPWLWRRVVVPLAVTTAILVLSTAATTGAIAYPS